VPEAETHNLQLVLKNWREHVSSAVAWVEVVRALRRATAAIDGAKPVRGQTGDRLLERAETVLARLGLIAVDEPVLRRAGRLDPPALRSLDAIHLATALTVEGLAGMITYDPRLAAAARKTGIDVLVPGAR